MKYIVIKIGGSTLQDLHDTIITDLHYLKTMGIHPIVVHGGGPFINQNLKKHGITPVFRDGLRVTDKETLSIMRNVLIGEVNTNLVAKINQYDSIALGLNGSDIQLFNVEPLDRKYGYVGSPTHLNTSTLLQLTHSFIPVICSIGYQQETQQFYNINADTLAYYIAATLTVPIYVLSDVTGVKIDDHIRGVLNISEIEPFIEKGEIYDGMIPKVRQAREAIQHGCPQVVIASGSKPHIIRNIYSGMFLGTIIQL